MLRSITQKKPEEEIDQLLANGTRIFIIGCGTCTTLTQTGGEAEVKAMKEKLTGKGKLITKGLLNGPCGGTKNGKCEIDENKDCAWTLIYNRLKELKQLEAMKKFQGPRNYQKSPRPGKYSFTII